MGHNGRLFVWALIIASLLALLIVGRALWGEFEARGSRMPRIASGQTAQQARDAVETWLADWHADGGIINCATSYQRGETNAEAGWQVQVYSPGKKQIAILRVRGQEIWVLREVSAPYPQNILPEAAWQVDSDEMMDLWWQHEGQVVWSRTESEALHVRLALNKADAPTWHVTVTQRDGIGLTFWEIAADTGDILQTSQTGGAP
jgi:hypothetical protein